MNKSVATFFAAALAVAPLRAQESPPRPLPSPTGVFLLDEARRTQRMFEEFRRANLPPFTGGSPGGSRSVKDRDIIGKFQYWYDEREPPPPPEPMSIRAQRAALLRVLDSAAKAYPEDEWTAGQRVRYLSEEGRTKDEVTAALQCKGASWWCNALLGFAFHESRDFIRADSAYNVALRQMSLRQRCDWLDATVLMDEPTARTYHRNECGTTERIAFEERMWWVAKPLYSTPGVDTRTEYLSRMTMVRMLEDAPSVHQFGFDIDERELLLRYSWPRAWTSAPAPRPAQPMFGRGGMNPEPPPDIIIGHEPSPSYQFLMPALTSNSLATSDSVDWETGVAPVHARYAPSYARKIGALTHQSALFRRGDSSLVVVAWDATTSELALAQQRQMAIVLVRADSLKQTITKVPNAPLRGSMVAKGPWSQLLMSAELTAPGIDTAVRARYGLRPPWGLGARVTLSEMLFFEPYGNDSLPTTVEEAAKHAMASIKIRNTQKLGVFFESYGTNPAGEKLKLTFTVAREEDDPGFMRRRMQALRLSKEASPVRVTIEDPSLINSRMTPRAAYIDIKSLKPGSYIVQLEVDVAGQQYSVRTERALEVLK